MEIKITTDGDVDVRLSNDGFQNLNYITIRLGAMEVDVSITELYSALTAFLAQKREDEKTQASYK